MSTGHINGPEASNGHYARLLWSVIERLTPRLVSAASTAVVAVWATPSELGIYAWMVAFASIVLSVSDSPINQLAPWYSATTSGQGALRAYVRIAPVLCAVVMGAAWLGTVVLSPMDLRTAALSSVPLVFYPSAFAVRALHLGQLQARHAWRLLARLQLLATLVSLLPFLALVLLGASILGTAMQSLVSEGVFSLLVLRATRVVGTGHHIRPISNEDVRFGSEFRQYATMGLLGMIQAQAEKILIGSFAGPSRLGSYATASSAARSVGDSFSMASGNVVRATLAGIGSLDRGDGRKKLRDAVDPIAFRSVVVAMAIALSVGAGAKALLPLFLGVEWSTAVQIVPILCVATVATALSWSVTPILRELGRLNHATWVRIMTLGIAVPVALAAKVDLELAAWISVGRELVMLAATGALCGSAAPRRAFAASWVGVIVLSSFVFTTKW